MRTSTDVSFSVHLYRSAGPNAINQRNFTIHWTDWWRNFGHGILHPLANIFLSFKEITQKIHKPCFSPLPVDLQPICNRDSKMSDAGIRVRLCFTAVSVGYQSKSCMQDRQHAYQRHRVNLIVFAFVLQLHSKEINNAFAAVLDFIWMVYRSAWLLFFTRYIDSTTVTCTAPENEDAVKIRMFYKQFVSCDSHFKFQAHFTEAVLYFWQLSEELNVDVAIDGQSFTNKGVNWSLHICHLAWQEFWYLLRVATGPLHVHIANCNGNCCSVNRIS